MSLLALLENGQWRCRNDVGGQIVHARCNSKQLLPASSYRCIQINSVLFSTFRRSSPCWLDSLMCGRGVVCGSLPYLRGSATVAAVLTAANVDRWPAIRRESQFVPIPPAFARYGVPVRILPWRLVWKNWNRMATRWLKKLKIFFVSTEYTNVTARRTDRLTNSRHCMAT